MDDCGMVLISCRKQVCVVESMTDGCSGSRALFHKSSNPHPYVGQAASMGPFSGDFHQKFVAACVRRCPRTLLLFWDHQLGDQFLLQRRKHVVVVFQARTSQLQKAQA